MLEGWERRHSVVNVIAYMLVGLRGRMVIVGMIALLPVSNEISRHYRLRNEFE